jgi:predicted O-methyltransferase YrrM
MSFKLPENSDWFVEQNQHGPTLEYAQEIFEVVSKHPYQHALEIGCIWGVSTISILLAGSGDLLSVDPIPQTNPSMHAMTEVRFNKLKNRWDYFTGRSHEFWQQNKHKFDLIYIDGSHNYQDVKLDLAAAWLCLSKGGLMLTDDYLHDHNHDSDYGVSLAVLEHMHKHEVVPVHMGKHCIGFVK